MKVKYKVISVKKLSSSEFLTPLGFKAENRHCRARNLTHLIRVHLGGDSSSRGERGRLTEESCPGRERSEVTENNGRLEV